MNNKLQEKSDPYKPNKQTLVCQTFIVSILSDWFLNIENIL